MYFLHELVIIADWLSFPFFPCRTGYPIDIAWLDYRGNIVRYIKELASGGVYHQNTYFTHPWIAWHSRTLERASFGGKKVFQPQPWQGEQHRTVVYIDRPSKYIDRPSKYIDRPSKYIDRPSKYIDRPSK